MRSMTHLLPVALAALLSSAALAEDIVFDTFSDGRYNDGDPGTWGSAFGRFIADARSGDVVARVNAGGADTFTSSERLSGDLSVRTQVRIENETTFGLVINFQGGWPPPLNDAYYLWLTPDGEFAEARLDNTVITNSTTAQLDEFVDVGDRDVVMQLDSVGDLLNGWIWTAGEAPPASPQLTVRLDEAPLLEDGFSGVWMDEGGNATIRYIQIADSPIPVPEPTSIVIVCAGLIGIAIRSRHIAREALL